MSVTIDKFFELSHLFAVDATLTVYHEQEMCKEAKNMDSEAVQAERNRVNQLVMQRRDTREEDTDVPPIVNLQEFIEIFNSDIKVGVSEPMMEATDADRAQGYIHIGNPPNYYVSLVGSTEWKLVDLAEVIRRQMGSVVEGKRDAILDGLDSNTIRGVQVDKVMHIVINGINAIYYNGEPERRNVDKDSWIKIDLQDDYKQKLDEHAALAKKVEAQEQTILELRTSLETLRPAAVETSVLNAEERALLSASGGR